MSGFKNRDIPNMFDSLLSVDFIHFGFWDLGIADNE